MASTTTLLPPARLTTRSGRNRPSSLRTDTCSAKSHRDTRPATSTALRRCSSPQRPRTCGLRSAVDSEEVSRRSESVECRTSSTCCLSWLCHETRWCSRSRIWSCRRSRPSLTTAWSAARASSASRAESSGAAARARTQRPPTSAPRSSPTSSVARRESVVPMSMPSGCRGAPTEPDRTRGPGVPAAGEPDRVGRRAWPLGPCPRSWRCCSRPPPAPAGPTSRGRGGPRPAASPSGGTPGGGPSGTVGPVRGGPLGFDGSGRFCSSHPSRDFVYGDDILDTVEPIEIESLALVGASGVRIVDAWVMPVRGVPLSGDWAQWPLPRTDLGGKVGLEWNEREPAEGAFLDPRDDVQPDRPDATPRSPHARRLQGPGHRVPDLVDELRAGHAHPRQVQEELLLISRRGRRPPARGRWRPCRPARRGRSRPPSRARRGRGSPG